MSKQSVSSLFADCYYELKKCEKTLDKLLKQYAKQKWPGERKRCHNSCTKSK